MLHQIYQYLYCCDFHLDQGHSPPFPQLSHIASDFGLMGEKTEIVEIVEIAEIAEMTEMTEMTEMIETEISVSVTVTMTDSP